MSEPATVLEIFTAMDDYVGAMCDTKIAHALGQSSGNERIRECELREDLLSILGIK